jgi:hypothetical protein
MHGLCSLKLQGHLDHMASTKISLPDNVNLMEQTFDGFISMLEKLK